jgi:hypothetical protein
MTAQLELFGAGADLERRVLVALQALARAKYPGWRYTTVGILSITQAEPEEAVDASLRALEERGQARRCPLAQSLWTLAVWPSRDAAKGTLSAAPEDEG